MDKEGRPIMHLSVRRFIPNELGDPDRFAVFLGRLYYEHLLT